MNSIDDNSDNRNRLLNQNIPKSLETLHKEIDLIQACIDKYDKRSLLIKGWSIALIALIAGLTQKGLLIFEPKAIPIALSLLLYVNMLFYFIDKYNNNKKWQYTQLYKWTITHRPLESNEHKWEYVYDLNYKRFDDTLSQYEGSNFSKKVYTVTWFFILSLMVWYTIVGYLDKDITKETDKSKTEVQQ